MWDIGILDEEREKKEVEDAKVNKMQEKDKGE